MAETPTLHLHLGTDAATNRNWEILDDAMHRLARGVQIPDDLSVLGSLDVRDNLTVGGTATVSGGISAAGGFLSTGTDIPTTLHGPLYVEDEGRFAGFPDALRVDTGNIVFPPFSLEGAFFEKNASVQTVAASTPNVNLLGIPVAPGVVLNSLDVADDDNRVALVLAQTTLQIGLAADATVNGSVSYSLKRGSDVGGVSVQTRAFQYAFTRAQTLSFPITIVRVGVPVAADARRWSLVATASAAPAPATLTAAFTQIHYLQLR
jgi:hypothetical protein